VVWRKEIEAEKRKYLKAEDSKRHNIYQKQKTHGIREEDHFVATFVCTGMDYGGGR